MTKRHPSKQFDLSLALIGEVAGAVQACKVAVANDDADLPAAIRAARSVERHAQALKLHLLAVRDGGAA